LKRNEGATAKEVVEHFISSGKRNVPTKKEVWYLIAKYKKAGAGCWGLRKSMRTNDDNGGAPGGYQRSGRQTETKKPIFKSGPARIQPFRHVPLKPS
jgi:hypothetical protein